MSGLLNTQRRDQPPRERAPDLNRAFEAIRTGRGLTRKQMARAETKAACRVVNIDRQKLADSIANGEYPCAPETKPGVARVYEINDLVCLYIFARLTERGEPAKRAGEIACSIRAQLERTPKTSRVVLVEAVMGAKAAFDGEKWDLSREDFKPGSPMLRQSIWHVGAVRALILYRIDTTGPDEPAVT